MPHRLPITEDGFRLPIPERTETSKYEFAFHSRVARQIKERDDWKCLCGEGKKEGLRVQAAHLDHNRRNPYYNNECNGRCLCMECHLREHISLLEEASYDDVDWAWHSVRLMAQDIWKSSFHTKGYIHKKGKEQVIEEDRGKLVKIFDDNDLDLFEFITIDENEL
jgi:hypothetical protein